MSTTNIENVYNEVTHTNTPSGDVNGLDPMYHWDTHYPERFSINTEFPSPVARRSRKGRNRNSARFKTQPITFDEIKEVDEEATDEAGKMKSKEGLKSHFTAFSRSMDGLVPQCHALKMRSQEVKPLSSDYNKNQISCKPLSSGESRLSPASDSPPETGGTEAPCEPANEPESKSSNILVPTPQLSDSARNRRQKRFKKKQRHSRSIEEEIPEMDRMDADEAVR